MSWNLAIYEYIHLSPCIVHPNFGRSTMKGGAAGNIETASSFPAFYLRVEGTSPAKRKPLDSSQWALALLNIDTAEYWHYRTLITTPIGCCCLPCTLYQVFFTDTIITPGGGIKCRSPYIGLASFSYAQLACSVRGTYRGRARMLGKNEPAGPSSQ